MHEKIILCNILLAFGYLCVGLMLIPIWAISLCVEGAWQIGASGTLCAVIATSVMTVYRSMYIRLMDRIEVQKSLMRFVTLNKELFKETEIQDDP